MRAVRGSFYPGVCGTVMPMPVDFPPLEPNEELLWEGKPRPAVLLANSAKGALLGSAAILTLVYLGRLVAGATWSSPARGLAYLALGVAGLLAALMVVTPLFALRMLGRAGNRITSQRLVLVSGLARDGARTIPLRSVWRVEVTRSFAERLLGAASIRFHAGPDRTTQGGYDVFPGLTDVDAALAALRRALRNRRDVELVDGRE
jgi:uncharacterized membrane protein YdbT with pleckstrin-like domain